MTNKEAIEKLKEILFMTGYKEALNIAIKALEERPHGKWIICNQDNEGIHKIECPFCKYTSGGDFEPYIKVTFDKLPNYCEYCGADMRGGEDGK